METSRYDGRWNNSNNHQSHWRIDGEKVFFCLSQKHEWRSLLTIHEAMKLIDSNKMWRCGEHGEQITIIFSGSWGPE